jgi:hypothetical protein
VSLANVLSQQAIQQDQDDDLDAGLAPGGGLSSVLQPPSPQEFGPPVYSPPVPVALAPPPQFAQPQSPPWDWRSALLAQATPAAAQTTAGVSLPPPGPVAPPPAPTPPPAAVPAGPPVAPAGAPNPFAAAGAGGVQTIKTPASTVSTVSPEVRAGLSDSNQAQQQAIAGQMGAESSAAEAQAATEDAKAQALKDEAASQGAAGDKTIARADDRAAAATKERGLLDQAHADLAGQKIDPNRWWNSQSTGQKIALGLAAAFSGFSAGIHGGANQALELVQKHIADDVAAQQENFDRQKGAVTAKDQAFQYFYDKVGGDKEAAARLATSFGLEQAAKVAAAHVQETASPSAKAAGAKVIALLQEKAAEVQRQGALDLEKTQRFTPAGTQQVMMVGGQPVAIDAKKQAALAKFRALHHDEYEAADKVLAGGKLLRAGEELPGLSGGAQTQSALTFGNPHFKDTDVKAYRDAFEPLAAGELGGRKGRGNEGTAQKANQITRTADALELAARRKNSLDAQALAAVIGGYAPAERGEGGKDGEGEK